MVIFNGEWAGDDNMKPLVDRAWAFQEWLLSKRLVHFGRDQVRWECYCLAASEVFPAGFDDHDLEFQGTPTKSTIVSLVDEPENTEALWDRIKMEYSQKALTNGTDKLAAFSGISRLVYKVMKLPEIDFIVGLSKSTLLRDLLWERYEEVVKPQDPAVYMAPTWSWASMNSPFWRALDFDSDRSDWLVRVLDLKVTLVDDAFGPIRGASLSLGCLLSHIIISSPPDKLASSQGNRTDVNNHEWTISAVNGHPISHGCYVKLDRTPLGALAPSTQLTFYLVPVYIGPTDHDDLYIHIYGLVLQKHKSSQGQYIQIPRVERKILSEYCIAIKGQ